jgi:hypothetical protein
LDTFFAILIIVAVVAGVFLLRRGTRAATRAAMQRLLYRSEYQEGKQIVSAPIRISIQARASDIMREVTAQVTTAQLPLGLKGVVYESSRTADRITYAFGNMVVPKSFEAEVLCASHGATTDAAFSVLAWRENDGLILGRETLQRLRKEVLAGFAAAGADTTIIDGLAIEHGPASPFLTDTTGLKKYGFGVVGGVLAVIAIVKVSVIGFYPSEAPLYIGMLIAGGVCLYVSTKIKISKGGEDAASRHAVPASDSTTPVHVQKADSGEPADGGDRRSTAQGNAEKVRYCTGCGSPVRAAAAFCGSCGATVSR